MATPTPLNPDDKTKIEWLSDQGHKAALMVGSSDSNLQNLGRNIVVILAGEYAVGFPARVQAASTAATNLVAAKQQQMATAGPKLWGVIHGRALQFKPADATDAIREMGWLKAFGMQIPCGECRAFFVQWLNSNPPVLATSEAYFNWTVDMHNAVNLKLSKPQKSYAEAHAAWPFEV